jgi:1-phosphofructokinase family hexose kinase
VAAANAVRMNLEILEDDGTVTEILEPGQPVTRVELEQLRDAFEFSLQGSAGKMTVILSGSLPPGVPDDFYATLIGLGHKHDCRLFVDTSGEPLRLALKAEPDFVKPNQEEAEWLSGCVIEGAAVAERALKNILSAGARSGAISLGASGLIWRSTWEDKTLIAKVPQLAVRSSVGSGDATLAAFAFADQQGFEPAEALRLAAACGAANCLAEGPGRARAEDIARLKKEIRVEILQ